ncbi:DNA cytosine methyltransferase [Lysinibacillus sphaericus]|uniref:DNA cytosine methyltransferase n=1 Tax=Lysinibacillus sphaericus TaxID=1421 RepID=UPI00055BA2FE|nr:DNA cytosine methyltransferase [Lysinibacillus sphaericus]
MAKKLKLLDLFCKAGGCSAGYAKAGFDVTGVDIEQQPNYPFNFIQGDALEVLKDKEFVSQFDAIAASPPCQFHTKARQLSYARNNGAYGDHLDLIPETRALLKDTGKPYVIENVAGSTLENYIRLFGSQFKGLYTQRERWFESNILLTEPEIPYQKMKTPSAGNGIGEDGSISICGSGGVRGLNAKQITLYWGFALGGINWMTRAELAEAIPPAYTEFIGKQLKEHLMMVPC